MYCDESEFEQSNFDQNMDYHAILLKLTILTLLGFSQAKRAYSIELNTFNCVVNDPSIIGNLTCIIHKKRSNPSVSVGFFVKQTMKKLDVQIYVNILKKDKSKVKIGQVRYDVCKFLSSFYKDRYGILFKRVLSASNFPRKCPVQGNQSYSIRNYTYLADDFPPAAPAMTVQMQIKILKPNNSSVADVVVEGSSIY